MKVEREISLENCPWLDAKAKPFIEVQGLSKQFGDVIAVDNINLKIYRNELFCLLGGSGCGKTTLLRMLAGFETPSSGRVLIDNEDITDIPPYQRPVNMMFQSYALFPHMTVERNIAYGLLRDKVPKPEIKDRVYDALHLVQLEDFAKRRPDQLSGGQRQRVALARAIVKQPKVLLLDEPLGALDKKLREQTQFELMAIQERIGITFVVVTHDQEEAMTLATRIAIMNEGELTQVDTPTEVYEFPKTRFAADFIGSINLMEGRIKSVKKETIEVDIDNLNFTVISYNDGKKNYRKGEQVSVALRPEKITVTNKKHASLEDINQIDGVVHDMAYLGNQSIFRVKCKDGTLIKTLATNRVRLTEEERSVDWDDEVYLSWEPRSVIILSE